MMIWDAERKKSVQCVQPFPSAVDQMQNKTLLFRFDKWTFHVFCSKLVKSSSLDVCSKQSCV